MSIRNTFDITINNLPSDRANITISETLRRAGICGKCDVPALQNSLSIRWAQYEFGSGRLNYWRSTPVEFNFDAADRSKQRSSFYRITYVKRGNVHVFQNGRECTAFPGDCFITNSRLPYKLTVSNNCDGVILTIPGFIIENWIPDPDEYAAYLLSQNDNWGQALGSILRALSEAALTRLAVTPDIVLEQISIAVALAVGQLNTDTNSYKKGILRRLRHSMREAMHQVDLNPQAIAKQNGLSLRTLHGVFAEARSSFCEELREMRMAKARQFLESENFRHKSIAEISLLVGYRYVCHFIAHFRRNFHTTPAKFRKKFVEADCKKKRGSSHNPAVINALACAFLTFATSNPLISV